MRTKTLLLAAGALAAGIASSQAQNVYSQNIVGYVQVISPGTPGWVCAANPLDLDGVDNITNVLGPTNFPKGGQVELFTASGFSIDVKRSTIGAGAWTANAATTFIPPGVGFMIQTPSPWTNTFVGNVIPAPIGTNTMALTGSLYQLIGSPYPVSGTLTNGADQGPGVLNLGSSLPKGTIVETWVPGTGFVQAAKRSTIGAGLWTGNPTFTPGEGFFVNPGAGTNWQQIDTAP
ncbi:MAG: hypothetical protein ABR955_02850 [Verrucomicrobiota bacterium]|jgi:hypothetical protein